MNADEIRAVEFPATIHMRGNKQRFEMLREIAAQLAEQNQAIREDRELRHAIVEEERAARIKRDEMLSGYGGTLGKVADSISPSQPPPRLVFPGEVVHLGCLIREPDGTHAIASDAGLIRLEPAEAQRILSLISPPDPETKPS